MRPIDKRVPDTGVKKIFREKKGTSMVEVLVAFIIVLLMTTMFGKVVTASVRILQQSRTAIERDEEFEAKYYQTSEQDEDKRVPVCKSFTLSVNTEETDRRNQAKESSLAMEQGELRKYEYVDDKGNTGIVRYSIETEDLSGAISGGE